MLRAPVAQDRRRWKTAEFASYRSLNQLISTYLFFGTAQMMTVLAWALGPLLLAKCHAWTGSYAAVFWALASVVVLIGIAAWCVKLPATQTE